jgi:hypothetical protein
MQRLFVMQLVSLVHRFSRILRLQRDCRRPCPANGRRLVVIPLPFDVQPLDLHVRNRVANSGSNQPAEKREITCFYAYGSTLTLPSTTRLLPKGRAAETLKIQGKNEPLPARQTAESRCSSGVEQFIRNILRPPRNALIFNAKNTKGSNPGSKSHAGFTPFYLDFRARQLAESLILA